MDKVINDMKILSVDTDYQQLLNGRGFSRSNLSYMRKFYLAFPKCETVSHILTWRHYFEILKCDEPLEMQFYLKQCINEGWKVRELKRQMKSALYYPRTCFDILDIITIFVAK